MGLDMHLYKKSDALRAVEVGYWRKANQIHSWFVKNVQDGVDECDTYPVTHSKLLELKKACQEVLASKDSSKLPPTSGFFFGSIAVDEYYFADLHDTIGIIDSLDPNGEYCYRASW